MPSLKGCAKAAARPSPSAVRLQELPKELKLDVLVSRDTVALAGDTEYRFRPLGATQICGRDQALEILTLETA